MTYYYLDSDRKLQGPYSAEDLNMLKANGVINDDTLAAAAGDSNWKPFRDLAISTKCSTWNNEIKCPFCEKQIEERFVPNRCPHCAHWIHGNELGLWGAFVHGMKNFANFKGRATRTEFWGFFLFSTIIKMLCNKITQLLCYEESTLFEKMVDDNKLSTIELLREYLSSAAVLTAISIDFLVWVVIFIPFIAVSVRRLHDTGRTATPVVLATCSLVMVYIGGIIFLWRAYGTNVFSENENAYIQEYFSLMLFLGASTVFYIILSVYLFIMMLLASQPGSNKFGPCAFIKKI